MWVFKTNSMKISGRLFAVLIPLLILALLASTGQAAERAYMESHSYSDAVATIPAYQGPDSVIRVYESTFNELAAAIEPLQMNGRYKLRVRVGWCPLCKTITICDSAWTVNVTQLDFDIDATDVDVTGKVNASWCSIPFSADLNATGDVAYSSGQEAVLVTMGSTSIQPYFYFWGYRVNLPTQNVGPTLNLDPIPVTTAWFSFETARGSRSLRMTPNSTSLFKQDGYIELQSDFRVW